MKNRLRELRAANNWSQEELGGRVGVSRQAIIAIEAGRFDPSLPLAFKLARRLVSDDPPPALVNRAAATFTRTDGDIAAVVRTIVTSPEFFSRAAFRAKVKTPFELVVSARRAIDAPADTTPATVRQIAQLGMPMFGWATPEGWPDRGDAWMNFGEIYKRIRFGADMAEGQIASAPLARWRDLVTLSSLPFERQVDGVVIDVLGGSADSATRRMQSATQRIPCSRLTSGRCCPVNARSDGAPSSLARRTLAIIAATSRWRASASG